jgi:hypothetical protein
MPWDMIGQCGMGKPWELQLGVTYLENIFDEPEGCEIGIMYTEYERMGGESIPVPSIGLFYEGHIAGIASFAARLQNALGEFDQNVDWTKIGPQAIAEGYQYQLSDSGNLRVLDRIKEEDEE